MNRACARRAEFYYWQLDALRSLRRDVRRDLLAESKKHKAWKRLCQIPSIGPIRAAVLLGIGPPDLSQKDCHDRTDRMEERSVLRRPTSETKNSLSVSDRVRSILRIFSSGGCSGSRDTLVRERVSAGKLGAVCLGHVVSQPTLGPLG